MPTRRALLNGVSALVLLAVVAVPRKVAAQSRISAAEAHAGATEGKLLLVDIRTPAEWKRSGIGASAQPLSINDPAFLKKLAELAGGDRRKPIALICAVGGRSAYVQRELARAGYGAVADVAEGMLGSRAGPGWIRSGLPLKRYTE